jgi:hypothetical protein
MNNQLPHSSAAFIASSLQTEELTKKMLGEDICPRNTSPAMSLLSNATANATTPLDYPLSATSATQKSLSRRVDEIRLFKLVEATTDTHQRALLSSVQLKHTGDYLNVIPSPQLGLKLQDTEFRLACQFRLGIPFYPHGGLCPFCEKPSDALGEHVVSACGHSGDRTRRHASLRDALFAIAQAAMLAPKKEEKNLLDDSSRPGDITIPNWHRCQGRPTAFEVTVTSPLQPSYINRTIADPTIALEEAAEAKYKKCRAACEKKGLAFVPLPVSTFGAWLPAVEDHIQDFGLTLWPILCHHLQTHL